jgi:hypothetical protein
MEIRRYYQDRLDLPFPISLCPLKEYENENRLRFLEKDLQRPFYKKYLIYCQYYRYTVLSKLTLGARRKYYERKREEYRKEIFKGK